MPLHKKPHIRVSFDAASLPLFTAGKPYLGEYETGLYPGAQNEIPKAHQDAGRRLAGTIQPLNGDGKPDDRGRIGAIVLGHSNCRQYFNALGALLEERRAELHPAFELLNAAVGGQQLPYIVVENSKVWPRADEVMAETQTTPAQVQALFLHTTWHGAGNREWQEPGVFPEVMKEMQRCMGVVLGHCVERFPNLRIAYLTCDGFRHWTGFEPHVWREAFAFKWTIESQIRGEAGTAFEGPQRILPWLQWGPYIWDNTMDPSWFTDGVHPGPQAEQRFARMYWDFLQNDPVARGWLIKGA